MHQSDLSIIEKSNIHSNTLIINQCNKNDYFEQINKEVKIRMISTEERGLSRSRNMAIKYSEGDICLLVDDDEILVDNVEEIIINAFREYPAYDVIAFSLLHPKRNFPSKFYEIRCFHALKIRSWQIAFKRNRIIDKEIRFDEKMGSGTNNGGGEEHKFLLDCLKNKLKIAYVPQVIAQLNIADSQWFNGFTNHFFLNRGWTNQRMMGKILAFLYAIEYSIAKYPEYKKENSLKNAIWFQIKGIFINR